MMLYANFLGCHSMKELGMLHLAKEKYRITSCTKQVTKTFDLYN